MNRRLRITASGGEVGRLNTGGGAEVTFLHALLMLIVFKLLSIFREVNFYKHKFRC